MFLRYERTYCKRSRKRRAELSGFIAAITLVMIQLHITIPTSIVTIATTCEYELVAGTSPYPTDVMVCTAQYTDSSQRAARGCPSLNSRTQGLGAAGRGTRSVSAWSRNDAHHGDRI